MAFRTIFVESPCRLRYQSGYMVMRKANDTIKIHLSEIASVVLQTQQVHVSAYLLAEFAENNISFVVADASHNPIGQYLPLYGSYCMSKHIQKQIAWGLPIKKRVWQHIVKDKIARQAELLIDCEHEVEGKQLKAMVSEVRSGDTTNCEAIAARLYFKALFGDNFNRDNDCAINAALNYGYAIVLSSVNREIVARGYLTSLGIFHHNEFNQFNLTCDFMEPFRPIVDRLVIYACPEVFNKEMKHMLGKLATQTIQYRDGTYKVGSVIGMYVHDCLNALNKEIKVNEIEGFTVTW